MTQQLRRQVYLVLVDQDGEDIEHRVTVIHGDQIRAERTARQRGLPSLKAGDLERPSLWVWHALVRTEVTKLKYDEWVDTVLQLRPEDDGTGKPASEPVDPTQSAADTSSP